MQGVFIVGMSELTIIKQAWVDVPSGNPCTQGPHVTLFLDVVDSSSQIRFVLLLLLFPFVPCKLLTSSVMSLPLLYPTTSGSKCSHVKYAFLLSHFPPIYHGSLH